MAVHVFSRSVARAIDRIHTYKRLLIVILDVLDILENTYRDDASHSGPGRKKKAELKRELSPGTKRPSRIVSRALVSDSDEAAAAGEEDAEDLESEDEG